MVKEEGHSIVETQRVPIVGIKALLNDYVTAPPDFVSLDVEGLDLAIMRGWDFESCRPTAFCVESITYSTKGMGRKIEEFKSLFKKHGYFQYADTNINSIYLLEERWRRPHNGVSD